MNPRLCKNVALDLATGSDMRPMVAISRIDNDPCSYRIPTMRPFGPRSALNALTLRLPVDVSVKSNAPPFELLSLAGGSHLAHEFEYADDARRREYEREQKRNGDGSR